MKSEGIVDNLITKANIFNFLVALYCEPDAEVLWNENFQKLFLDNVSEIDKEIYGYAFNIVKSLEQTTQIELLQEYSRIFLGPFEVIAHPYASVYLEGYTLNGEITQNILHFYNTCGLLYDEEVKELPDNIVIIFQFLHYLTQCEINGNEDFPDIDWSAKMKEFLEKYVDTWIPEFTENIINGTQNEFYRNLALLTRKFLQIV